MEAIKCPNCGFGSCTQIDSEKWACPACDNIFQIHNLSKEFTRTDRHITEVHQDLKRSIEKINNIERMADRNYLSEEATLEKAELHLRNGDYPQALECFTEVAEEYPDNYLGWYGRYRAMTGEFTQVERYALYLCGGEPAEYDRELYNENEHFMGSDDVRKALMCSNADTERIYSEVSDFIYRCAEYGKADAENIISDCREGMSGVIELRNSYLKAARSLKATTWLKSLAPLAIVVVIIGIIIYYLTQIQEEGGAILVIAILAVIVFIFRRPIFRGLGWVFGFGFNGIRQGHQDINEELSELMSELSSNESVNAFVLRDSCDDIDNYSYIMSRIEEDSRGYIDEYVNNPFENMIADARNSDDEENIQFVMDFLMGKIERFRYLAGLEGLEDIDEEVNENGGWFNKKTTSIVAYCTFIGFAIAYFKGDKKGAAFHLNQALICHCVGIILNCILPPIGFILSTIICVIGIINAVHGEEKELPVIGRFRLLKNGNESSNTSKPTRQPKQSQQPRQQQRLNQPKYSVFCPACGAELDDDAMFCDECGCRIE